jgi:hypothetical protein
MPLVLAPVASWALTLLSALQDAPGGDALLRAAPEAREAWERLCAASGGAGREPLRAFQLEADVLTRSGVQRNEAHIDYSYLAPDCIRFVLPSRNETGRFGPAPEQYWLKTGGRVVVLSGRDYREDRKAVDDMLALARNYAALSSPARLDLRALERLPSAPADLGPELAKRARKLAWLALESPDFALVRREVARGEAPSDAPAVYRVELGLREDHLPAFAIVRERGKGGADPLLVEFSQYQEQDGFRMPFQIRVHVLDRAHAAPSFAPEASQEVYVTSAALRPSLTAEAFVPKE